MISLFLAKICAEAKPNLASDRGLVGALPIPLMVNEIIYVDFISMDEYNSFDYVLTIVDGLSRFAQFVPTKKKVDGEGVLKLLFQHWIQPFGKPKEVYSDNDIRFSSSKGWWQSVLKAIHVKVNFATPRHPESNGLCERINRSFLQNMRILMMGQKSKDWIRLVPYCTWIMNSQVHMQTGISPCELFWGRPAWIPDFVPDPEANPTVQSWINDHMEMQDKARKRLQKLREAYLHKANKGRQDASFKVDDYVLVHKRRFPQWKITKLGTQWFGPYRVIQVKHSALIVRTSPKLGGEIEVSYAFLKKFPACYDDDMEEEANENDVDVAERDDANIQDQTEEMTVEEHAKEGFFMVEKIIKHKYKQGWRFLTMWENYGIDDATWEPISCFVHPDGRLNTIFKEYCEQHGLQHAFKKAMDMATAMKS